MNTINESNFRAGLFLGVLFGGLAWGWGNVTGYALLALVLWLWWARFEFTEHMEAIND